MADLDDFDAFEEEEEQSSNINKKKIVIFLLPILIAIGIAVGMYHTFGTSDQNQEGRPYKILNETENTQQPLIFYDLPEINTPLKKTSEANEVLRLNMAIELTNREDIPKIEILLPRFYDIILAHINGLTNAEISGTEGMYWLKQELLYRLRLAAAPINIADIDIKSIEIQKNI